MSIFGYPTFSIGGGLTPLPQTNHFLINNRRGWRCRCIRRPNYFVPPVTNLVSSKDDSLSMLVENIELNAKISGSLVSVELNQIFINKNTTPIECIYKFPLDPSFVVTGVKIKMEDKVIFTDIMEKKKAKSKYDDTVAQGNTAVRVEYNEELPNIIEMNIGYLPENKWVEITVSLATTWFVIKHGHFSFIFPVNFLPTFIRNTSEISSIKTKFRANISLKSNSEIVSLCTSHEMKYTKDDNTNEYSIKLDETDKINLIKLKI